MDKSQESQAKPDVQPSTSNEPSALSSTSSMPSQDQIKNLLLVMTDREQKLSDLATQQQRMILWRVQFIRLEREWSDVIDLHQCSSRSTSFFTLDQSDDHEFRNETSLKSHLSDQSNWCRKIPSWSRRYQTIRWRKQSNFICHAVTFSPWTINHKNGMFILSEFTSLT